MQDDGGYGHVVWEDGGDGRTVREGGGGDDEIGDSVMWWMCNYNTTLKITNSNLPVKICTWNGYITCLSLKFKKQYSQRKRLTPKVKSRF